MQLIRPLRSQSLTYICQRCVVRRLLSSSTFVGSGHSRWSTVKHDKVKNDAAKNKLRSALSKEIAEASKVSGPNPERNTSLAVAIANAKRSSIPKSLIESAIARGQGQSASGAKLEAVMLEAILPPSLALIIECQTDSRSRTLMDLKSLLKYYGGSPTPTAYLFEKRGKITIKQGESTTAADDVLEHALEAGALDITEGECGTHVIFTEPAATTEVSRSLASSLEMEVASADIVWVPNEDTKVSFTNDDEVANFSAFLDEVQALSEVQAVHANVARSAIWSDDAWLDLRRRVNM